MNLVARQNFGFKGGSTWNTFIGGVSGTISTPALLATKLAIDVSRISNFTIVGSDIKCKITGSYGIPAETFKFNTTPCTYYRDTDNLVTSIGIESFYFTNIAGIIDFQNCLSILDSFKATPMLTGILLKNCTSVDNSCFAESTNGTRQLKACYIPSVTTLGTTSGNNSVFAGNCTGLKIYAHPSLATNNGGAPDGDLAYAISQGATVRYVTNFTAPNPVTDLSAGTIYNTAIQLNFTPPTGSTNAIDYYELYNNGVFVKNITVSGGYLTGLTPATSYNFTLIAVDIFYNKSVVSNSLSVSTNTTNIIDISKYIATYKLETNGNDSVNGYNGTVGSGATFANSECTFNGTSNAYVSVADNDAFSFGNGTTDSPFSISMLMQFANKATLSGYIPLSKSNNANNINDEYYLTIYNNVMYWRLMDDNTIASHIGFSYNISSLSNNTYYHFGFTYDGSKTYAGIKFYINGVLTTTTSLPSGTYTGMNNGTHPFKIGNDASNSFGLNGKIKNVNVFNAELSQSEMDLLYKTNQ